MMKGRVVIVALFFFPYNLKQALLKPCVALLLISRVGIFDNDSFKKQQLQGW